MILVVNFLRFLDVKNIFYDAVFPFYWEKGEDLFTEKCMIRWTQINTCAEAVKIFSSRFFHALEQ